MSASPGDNALIIVARAVRTRGLKGEVVAELLTDFPERFDEIEKLCGVSPQGDRREVELQDHWFQKDRIVLKFAGYDDVESAAQLVGWEFAVPEEERVSLPESYYYDWELEGCRVKSSEGKEIGTVKEVLSTGAAPILIVVEENDKEVLIPLAASIITRISIDSKLIVIDPPEGLLEL